MRATPAMKVALVNLNLIKPPIAPIGLEYLAEALARSGHAPEILDLCWEEDPGAAVRKFFHRETCGLVGLSLRNTDDCSFATRESFVPLVQSVVGEIKSVSAAPVFLGGSGFSVLPRAVLEHSGADAGIWGEGEFTFAELATRVEKNQEWAHLPNLIVKQNDKWHTNSRSYGQMSELPAMSRCFIDNRRYFAEGGQAGFETKRGCTGFCTYCADPVSKGTLLRTRVPTAVAQELASLYGQGIDHLHTCDSEFNIPEWHGQEVCGAVIDAGLGEKLRWYAYCSPVPFSKELAASMKRAGCVGINFGVDNGNPDMLRRLRRMHGPEDVKRAVGACRKTGLRVMTDLLLGSPGETRESVAETVDLMKKLDPDVVGVGVGVRIYKGTPLSRALGNALPAAGLTSKGLAPYDCENVLDPPFFLEPAVAPFIFDLLNDLIGDDERFFFFDPNRPKRNYNYNANQVLSEAIQRGERGAYWDILKRSAR